MNSPLDPQKRVGLPPSLLKFLREHIHSVEQLEVLLLLRSDSHRPWGAEELNEKLRSDLASVKNRLKDLEKRGFIRSSVEEDRQVYRFHQDPAYESDLEVLSECYRVYTVRVIEAIYSRPNDSIAHFSNSFRIKDD